MNVALALALFFGALLYSSGGHGGASAYLAAMALFSVEPALMKPAALLMNVLVASMSAVRFTRAGDVPLQKLRWLFLGSVPAAYAGGALKLSVSQYEWALGLSLAFAGTWLLLPIRPRLEQRQPSTWVWVVFGIVMGVASGLTGIGGGIFLSPLLLLTGWETPRRTAAAASVFIVVNSVMGLIANVEGVKALPAGVGVWALCAGAGGLVGSYLAAHRLSPPNLRRVHGTVLWVASLKLLWNAR